MTQVRVQGGWPPRDSAGSIQPHKLNCISMFRKLPWTAKLFETKVPETYWASYVDPETDELIAVIECGCGETVWTGGATSSECGCGRFFIFLVDEVRCFKPEEEADS